MQLLTRRALRVTVALTELRQSKGDVLDALIPFFEPILQVLSGKIFDPHQFSVGIQRVYHWKFTTDVAEQFIPRLVNKGYLRREGRGKNAIYVVTYQADSEADSGEDSVASSLNNIVDRFEKFAPVITDLLHYEKTRDQLTDILVRFLLSIGAYGSDPLSEAKHIASASASVSDETLAQLPEGGPPLEYEDRYIAARFVIAMCDEDPAYIEQFRRLSAVGLLTEVVEDFIRPITVPSETDLTIVLDAPLALDYIGLSGNAFRDDVRAVLTPLRNIGCKLVVFPITCEEMRRNLDSMLALPRSDRHGPTHKAMVRGEVDQAIVEAVANNPEASLEHVGISIRYINLSLYPNDHQYFSDDLYEDFLSYVTWVKEMAPREHDATCLALLMRLRQGRHSNDLFKSRFVFVTRNPAFAREARQYCVQSRLIGEHHESPVIHQRELATIAWLRTGLDAEENIPKASLIAACERVLSVRKEVTNAVAERLKQATTKEKLEQFELLLLDQRSLRKLADTTLNDERVVTDANAEQLLEVMRKATAEEAKAEYEAALRQKVADHRKAQKALKDERDAMVAANDLKAKEQDERNANVTHELNQARAALQQFQAQTDENLRSAVNAVNKKVLWLNRTATGLLLSLGLIAIAQSIVGTRFQWEPLKVVLAVLGVAGTYYLIQDMRQKPKLGLGNLLSATARRLLKRELLRRGLPKIDPSLITINDGRISVPANFFDDSSEEPKEITSEFS